MHTERRIIIAMPNQPLFDILNYNLAKRHYTVLHAHCGAALIAAIAGGSAVDLIIASRGLGDMDAFAALALLREQHPPAAAIPTLVIAATVDSEAVTAATQLGLAGFITEAFDLEDIIAKVEANIGASQVVESINLRGIPVISCRGSISAHHARQLRDAVNAMADVPSHKLVIDLTETEFLAHQVLVVLLSAGDKLKTLGGTLAICGTSAGITQMCKNAGVDSAIRCFPTRAQALQGI